LALLSPLAARAQLDLTGDQALEDLRKRNPAGDNDTQILKNWLKAEFDKITGPNPETGRFRGVVRTVRNDGATSDAFREALMTRLGEFARDQLASADLPRKAAAELVRTLSDANDPRVIPGYLNGLNHSEQEIRYLSAKGMQDIRNQIGDDAPAFIAGLQQRGVAEENGVVVERIYLALAFPNPTDELVGALNAILAARVERYRQGAVLVDNAEPTLLNYLGGVRLTDAQARGIVRQLAVFLRLDVADFGAAAERGQFLPGQRDSIERRICIIEEFLRQSVRPGQGLGGDICRKLGEIPVLPAALQFELNNWIGTPQTPGVLNDNPWNVPTGAP